ncbi:MAG: hypothetical protein LBJ11_02825 [Oscillospiraceae bacterium]|jgi:hypothetical protein|nr:hypothetical protein [Oscillospiraceae bacterium]
MATSSSALLRRHLELLYWLLLAAACGGAAAFAALALPEKALKIGSAAALALPFGFLLSFFLGWLAPFSSLPDLVILSLFPATGTLGLAFAVFLFLRRCLPLLQFVTGFVSCAVLGLGLFMRFITTM